MPAGNYVFTQQDGQSLVSIESSDRHHFAFVLMNPMSAKDSKGTPTLVFDRVGTDHILAKVIARGGAEVAGKTLKCGNKMPVQLESLSKSLHP